MTTQEKAEQLFNKYSVENNNLTDVMYYENAMDALLEAITYGKMQMLEKIKKESQEIMNRMSHFYLDMDGGYEFPNSKEGDLLKMVFEKLDALQEEGVTA